MASPLRSRWSKPVVFFLCLAPLAWGLANGLRGELDANPIEYITRATGHWTMRFLLITLSIMPLSRILVQPNLIRFGRMLCLFSFFYGVLHLITWAWLDKFFDAQEMWADVVKHRFITMGMLGFALMVPLALGGKNWQRLHRLLYISAAAGVITTTGL